MGGGIVTRCSDAIAGAVVSKVDSRTPTGDSLSLTVAPAAQSVILAGFSAYGANTPGDSGMALSGGGVTQLITHDAGHETHALGWAVGSSAATITGTYTPGFTTDAECGILAAIASSSTSPVQSKTGTTVAGGIGTAVMTFDAAPAAGDVIVLQVSATEDPTANLNPNDGLWTEIGHASCAGATTYVFARCVQPGDGSDYGTAGGSYARTAAITEWGPPAPTVAFTGTPTSGAAPLTVEFTGSATGFAPTSWDWDFGDGRPHGSGQTPSHVYSAPGTYSVTLTATDGTDSASLTRTDYITVTTPGIDVTVHDPVTGLQIAQLANAFDKFIRPERNAVGSGGFTIRRDDPDATDAALAMGNLVKVTIPQIDPDPIFSWFIESKTPVVVSADETGGEVVKVGGRGALAYFDWARWLALSYVVPWWSGSWADLVAGAPPDGSIGHVSLAAGTYNRFYFNSDGTVIYPPSTFTTGGMSAFYDRRQARRWEAGAPNAGKTATLVRLSTGGLSGAWIHPTDAGITDVRATSVLGTRPEFGQIGASDVTQWWDSGWGTPPGGTAGRVSVPAGSYDTYTVSGGKITGYTRNGMTTGGLSAWLDAIGVYRFASKSASGHLIRLSSGSASGTWLHQSDTRLRIWVAQEPDVSLVPGKVLWRVCEEVLSADRPSHPMPLLAYDFTEYLDSAGNDWQNTAALAGITADIGDSYLDTIGKILESGIVDLEMGPDLTLSAWNARGRDLAGSAFGAGVVRFEKGVNIADSLEREDTDGPAPTFTQVIGSDGSYATAELPDAAERVTRETVTRAETDDPDALAALGLADLTARLRRSEAAGFAILVGDGSSGDIAAGRYLPGPPGSSNGSFWLGDIVTLHTGTGTDDYDEDEIRIAAITIGETESGDLTVYVEVNSSLGAAEDAAFPGSSWSGSGTGTSGSSGSSSGSSGAGSSTDGADLSAYQAVSEKGIAGGYAALDGSALVPVSELPDVEELRTSEADTSLVLSPDGYGGLAFAAAPSAGLPWFDVTDYGAVHDGSTDDTPAIQNAIDAAEAAGGGVVFFPRGVYAVSGALQDTGRSNAQILLPRRHVTDGTEQLTVHLLGESAPPAIPYISGSSTEPEGGSVLKSTLSSGTGAVVGAWGPSGSYLDFSLVRVGIKNLCVRTVADPTISGLDLSHVEAVELADVMVDAGEYTMGSISQQTTSTSYGIKLPGNNNGASTFLRGVVNVVGFYNGVLVGEHTVADNVQVWAARKAYVFPAAYHASHFSRMAYYHCQRGLVGSASRHYVTVSQLDLEHAASGTWAPVYDVDDASDYLYGHLAWHAILEVTGYDSTFTVNGASNLHRIEIGSNPFGGPSFATPSIAYGTPAAGSSGDAVQSDATIPKPTAADVDFSSDVTTSNATTGHHGLLPKLDGNAAHYLDGTGAFSTPSGSGGGQYRAWLFSASGGTLTILTAVDGTPLTGLMDLE